VDELNMTIDFRLKLSPTLLSPMLAFEEDTTPAQTYTKMLLDEYTPQGY